MNDTRSISVECMAGAAPEHLPVYRIWQTVDGGGIERTRKLGLVMYHSAPQFISSVDLYEDGVRVIIGTDRSLPDAIDTLNRFHAMTRHQYAPWPTMMEDEGEE